MPLSKKAKILLLTATLFFCSVAWASYIKAPYPVIKGGTGDTSLAAHGVLIGQGQTGVHVTNPGTAGQIFTSNGNSTDPSFQAPFLAVAPVVQTFLPGLNTFYEPYAFIISAGNATANQTYTNNSNIYTVLTTVSGSTLVYMSGTGLPSSSGVLTKSSGGSGDATLNFSQYKAPLSLRVLMVGGGGGGSGSAGSSAGTSAQNGGNGGVTYFRIGASPDLLVANGGQGGQFSAANSTSGGAGGTASMGTVTDGWFFSGGTGGTGLFNASATSIVLEGGSGGSNGFGGGGTPNSGSGNPGVDKTGAGGAGGGTAGLALGQTSGSGGGAGGYIDAIIRNPALAYSVGVGAAGAGGSGLAGAPNGGAAGSGALMVTASYQ